MELVASYLTLNLKYTITQYATMKYTAMNMAFIYMVMFTTPQLRTMILKQMKVKLSTLTCT